MGLLPRRVDVIALAVVAAAGCASISGLGDLEFGSSSDGSTSVGAGAAGGLGPGSGGSGGHGAATSTTTSNGGGGASTGAGPGGGGAGGGATSSASSSGATTSTMASSSSGGQTCDLGGTWAMYTEVDVSWSGPLLADGSGIVQHWMLLDATQNGTGVSTVMLPCGVTLPDFGIDFPTVETYGLCFSKPLFDHAPPYPPDTSVTATVSSTAPGATYTTPTFAVLMGLTMSSPTTDPWPAGYSGVTQVDHDQDTDPGITIYAKQGPAYQDPPVNLVAYDTRADRVYFAMRQVTSLDGAVDALCTGISGAATVSKQDTHIVGCHVTGGSDCSASQTDFSDSYRVDYSIGAATFEAVKLDAGATCADVRAAFPSHVYPDCP